MTRRVSVAEAKAEFSRCVRDVENGESPVITRHGTPVAALVRPEDLQRLDRLRAAGPEGGLASLAGGWEGSEEFVQLLQRSPRRSRRIQGTLE